MTRLPERLPPCSIEAEQGALGSMLLDRDALYDLLAMLDPEDFWFEQNRILFETIRGLTRQGRPVDLLSVQAALEQRNLWDQVKQHEIFIETIERVPHAAHAAYYAEIVRNAATKRRYIEVANEILRGGYSTHVSASDLGEQAERSILGVGLARERDDSLDMLAAMDESTTIIERRRSGQEKGLKSGLAKIDEMIEFLPASQVTVIAARPSIGKSAMLLGMAAAVADQVARSLAQVLFASMEMPAAKLAGRLLSAKSGVNSRKINGDPTLLRDEDLEALKRARRSLADLPILFSQSVRQSVASIASRARRLQNRSGCAAVFVDYLQIVTQDQRHTRAPKHEQIAGISHDLFALAQELAIPVVVGAQLNRASEQQGSKKGGDENRPPKPRPPRLADLRESGAIEQDANTVLLLHRPEHHDPKDEEGSATSTSRRTAMAGPASSRLVTASA